MVGVCAFAYDFALSKTIVARDVCELGYLRMVSVMEFPLVRCVGGSVGLVLKPLRYLGSACTAQSDGTNSHDAKGIWR